MHPNREYQGTIRDLKGLNSRFLGPRMRRRIRSQNLRVRVDVFGAQHHAMPMQQNTIGSRHRGRMSKDNRASARALERLTLHARLTFLSPRPRSPVLRGGCSTPYWRNATNRIDALPQRFRLCVGSPAMEAQRLHAIATANNGSAALDECPLPKLAGPVAVRPACSSRSVRNQATGSRSRFPR